VKKYTPAAADKLNVDTRPTAAISPAGTKTACRIKYATNQAMIDKIIRVDRFIGASL